MRENSSRNQGGLKYQKLYNWGRTLIMSGVLRNMDKFPSEHMLQNKFGYSRQTVRNAQPGCTGTAINKDFILSHFYTPIM